MTIPNALVSTRFMLGRFGARLVGERCVVAVERPELFSDTDIHHHLISFAYSCHRAFVIASVNRMRSSDEPNQRNFVIPIQLRS